MTKHWGWIASVVLGAAPAAQAQPVGYEEVLQAVRTEQPMLRARELQIEARREAAAAADQLPDPRLKAGFINLPVTGPNPLDSTMMTMLQVGVEQDVPNLTKRRARAGVAGSDIQLAEARLEITERQLRVAAGQAWIELAFAERRLALASAAEDRLRELVPVALSAVASGSARPAESLEVRRAILEIADARTSIEAERETAQARLARYLDAQMPIAAGPAPAPLIEPVRLRSTLEQNPDLTFAGATISHAQAELRLAEAGRRPDFGVSVSYGRRDPVFGDVISVMGSMTLPIFAGRRQEPRIAAAEADTSAALAQREDKRRALVAALEADLAAWRSAMRQWERARDEFLPLARDRVDLETASFAARRADLIDVIKAETSLALLELEVLDRERQAVEAASRLRLTYGEDEQ